MGGDEKSGSWRQKLEVVDTLIGAGGRADSDALAYSAVYLAWIGSGACVIKASLRFMKRIDKCSSYCEFTKAISTIVSFALYLHGIQTTLFFANVMSMCMFVSGCFAVREGWLALSMFTTGGVQLWGVVVVHGGWR